MIPMYQSLIQKDLSGNHMVFAHVKMRKIGNILTHDLFLNIYSMYLI